jgi:hypothetical protein
MGNAQRQKGLRGEREVTHAFREAGLTVKNLDGGGDHLIVLAPEAGLPDLHLEVKRQETIRIADWSKQAETEAPAGCVAAVVYRRSHEPWRVSLKLDDFLGLLK